MADQIGKCDANNTPLSENAFQLISVKEEHEEDDIAVEKIHILANPITIDKGELQAHSIHDKVKEYDISSTLDDIKIEPSSSEVQYSMVHDNLKIEEGIGTDDIKIELDNGLLYCEDCHGYYQEYCGCGMLVHILNRTVATDTNSRSQDELPNDSILEIRDYFGEFRIFALKVIPADVRFGPFTGLDRTECAWKIKGGKFVANKDESKHLNWMQYINPARNISAQNLLVFQYEDNIYYQSTCQINEGDELLVYFGEEYDDSPNRSVEMDFVPATEHVFKDAFACTFCCLGFSSKLYLAKHKTNCPGNASGEYSGEELVQCPSCKIHLDRKEYIVHRMTYRCETKDRKYNRTTDVNGDKARLPPIYKCQQCKYKTKYKGDLKNHTNLHYAVKMHKCGVCCRRFKTKEVLRLHMENTQICAGRKEDLKHSTGVYTKAHIKEENSCAQDEMKPFKCTLCVFRTKYKLNLKVHIKYKHLKEFSHNCDVCDFKTISKSYLKIHVETKHLKVFKYKCDRCDFKTISTSYLKTHVETKHLKVFKYKCDLCDYKTNRKHSLTTHVETQHLKEFKYKCDRCDYKANKKANLTVHVNSKHLNEFKHKCDTCEYKTNWKSHLELHVETKHLNEYKYKCDMCHYKANWKSQLKMHIETNHLKEFKYKCDTCDYKAISKVYLKAHVETKHLNKFKYKCDTCDYKTNKKSNLNTHVETKHLKEFKYKCDTCEYKTNWKSTLNRHIDRKHVKAENSCSQDEIKPFKCSLCEFRTKYNLNLNVHVKRKHLKECKYKCDTCDYKTICKYYLKRHVETKHLKILKYKCDTCQYETDSKYALKKHIEGRHLKEFNYKCDSCEYKTNWTSTLRRHVEAKHLRVFK